MSQNLFCELVSRKSLLQNGATAFEQVYFTVGWQIS
jgi:hypothetical protein